MKSLCAVIAFKNTNKERLRNLNFLKSTLSTFNIDVIICEESECTNITEHTENNIKYIQVPTTGQFNKSRLYNIAIEDIDSEYILFLDADVFINFQALLETLESYDGDLAKPFDKTFKLNEDLTEKLISLNLKAEDLLHTKYCSYWGKHAILISKNLLDSTDKFDESFEGWGWEDLDFVHNQLKGKEPDVFNFSAFHLNHPIANKNLERKNYFLYKNKRQSGNKFLSFCTGIKNRLPQLKETLLENLESNLENRDLIEFILVDFDSSDGCAEWVLENCSTYLKTGFLKFFKILDFPYWHASICKNTAHFLGEGKILTNLDCDNYTGIRGGSKLIQIFQNEDVKVLHQWCRKEWFSGNYGRISIRRDLFYEMGGYDESLHNMAYQDTDLIERSKIIHPEGVFDFPHSEYNESIKNEKTDSIKNIPTELKEKGFDWLHKQNMALSKKKTSNNEFKANEEKFLHLYDKILAYSPEQSKLTKLCP